MPRRFLKRLTRRIRFLRKFLTRRLFIQQALLLWPTLKRNHLTFGRSAEGSVVHFLKRQGYHIIERNWRCRLGEIDIIAIRSGVAVFVEVKGRQMGSAFDAINAVDIQKQRQVRRVSEFYLRNKGAHLRRYRVFRTRFDIIGVYRVSSPYWWKRRYIIRHIENGFELTH